MTILLLLVVHRRRVTLTEKKINHLAPPCSSVFWHQMLGAPPIFPKFFWAKIYFYLENPFMSEVSVPCLIPQ